MLCIATYVDNLDRVRYDIPLVVENWEADRKIVFTGNDYTTQKVTEDLKGADISIVQSKYRATAVNQLPLAFNDGLNYCYDTIGADAVIFVHADMYMTKEGIRRYIHHYKNRESVAIAYMSCQLYTELWEFYSGAILTCSDDRISYALDSDSAGLSKYPKIYNNDYSLVLDMGYLTIDHYKSKMFGHNFLWPDPYKSIVLGKFREGMDIGLHYAYNKIRSVKQCKLTPVNVDAYGVLIDRFGVWDEFGHCLNVMKELS